MAKADAEGRAGAILKSLGIDAPPINVEFVARQRGVNVFPADLGLEVSGVLVVEDGQGTIGYNDSQAKVRQRFSIAHELGHYEMHRNHESLFVDKRYKIAFRDGRSARGEDAVEMEANTFAAALLMPLTMIRAQIKENHFDPADEESLDSLAELFQVSKPAMMFRLLNLGLSTS